MVFPIGNTISKVTKTTKLEFLPSDVNAPNFLPLLEAT